MEKTTGKFALIGGVCVVLAGLFWGSIGVFVRKLTGMGLSSMQVVALRSLFSAILLGIITLLVKPSAFRIRLRDLWMFLGTGIVSMVVFNWCYFTCIQRTTLPIACILMYTSPVFATLLAAALFHEKLTSRKLIALLAAFLGCFLVTGAWEGAGSLTASGILIGLCSGFFYALYSIFSHFALKRYSPLTITLYSFIFSALGAQPLSAPGKLVALFAGNSTLFLYGFGVSVVCCVIPYMLFTLGLSRLEVGRANVLVTVEILSVLFFSLAVFHEQCRWYNIAGVLLVIAALCFLSLSRSPTPHRPHA